MRLAIFVPLVLGVACCPPVLAQPAPAPLPPDPWAIVSSSAIGPLGVPGRYQIVQSPVNGQSVFLLDTITGKVWQLSRFVRLNTEPGAWQYMYRLDDEADIQAFAKFYGNKPPAPVSTSAAASPKLK